MFLAQKGECLVLGSLLLLFLIGSVIADPNPFRGYDIIFGYPDTANSLNDTGNNVSYQHPAAIIRWSDSSRVSGEIRNFQTDFHSQSGISPGLNLFYASCKKENTICIALTKPFKGRMKER